MANSVSCFVECLNKDCSGVRLVHRPMPGIKNDMNPGNDDQTSLVPCLQICGLISNHLSIKVWRKCGTKLGFRCRSLYPASGALGNWFKYSEPLYNQALGDHFCCDTNKL